MLIGKLRNISKFALCDERLVVELTSGEGRVGRVEGEGVEPSLVMEGLGIGDVQ